MDEGTDTPARRQRAALAAQKAGREVLKMRHESKVRAGEATPPLLLSIKHAHCFHLTPV
jgi:hypothetical protein